jgi:hypothetical protein
VDVPPQANDNPEFWEIDITPLVRKWVNGDMENHGLVIVADSKPGDFHNFTFHGPAADHALAPVLTISFDGHAK